MLIYLRHGSTVLNNPDRDKERLRGHLPVPLSPQGLDEAHQAAERLARHLVAPVDTFEASPLRRAQQTAEIVSQRIGMPSQPQPALADWNTGYMAGQLVKDVLPSMQYHVNNIHAVPRDGEPISDYLERFVPYVKAAAASPGVHLVVGHARGSSILEGIADPLGGVGGDVAHKFLLQRPNLKPGGIMIVPADWNIKIDNGGERASTATASNTRSADATSGSIGAQR